MKYRIKECEKRLNTEKLERVFLVQSKKWLFWYTRDWSYDLSTAEKYVKILKVKDGLRKSKPIKPIIHDDV